MRYIEDRMDLFLRQLSLKHPGVINLLIILVCVFYVFNSLVSSFSQIQQEDPQIIIHIDNINNTYQEYVIPEDIHQDKYF